MAFAGKAVAITVSLALLSGCGKKEEAKPKRVEPRPVSPHVPGMAKKPTTVVVPPFVEGKWKAVKISFTDKLSGKEAVYTIPVGGTQTIPDSGVTIRVETFLPHFTMEGTTLTSQTNQPKNPATQVIVLENGQPIFKGWLFSMYPTTHAFQHPKFGFKLVGFVPAT
jgi:hypothetical protein